MFVDISDNHSVVDRVKLSYIYDDVDNEEVAYIFCKYRNPFPDTKNLQQTALKPSRKNTEFSAADDFDFYFVKE